MSGESNKIKEHFEAAARLETEAKQLEYLSKACPDPQIRAEIKTLLAARKTPVAISRGKTIYVEPIEIAGLASQDPYDGQTLDDKYRLERQLGQGGMGAVYLATHLGTDRYVAVKLIAPQFMRNAEFVERFRREARAAGRLRHPNIVDVTDFGFAQAGGENIAYLVMEYLDGCTLRDVLSEEKTLPLDWAVDILEQVCNAVHEAHKLGIVHRDLKPDNIWLEPNRLGGYRAKVLDFGIAKVAETGLPPSGIAVTASERAAPPILGKEGGVESANLTNAGTILGTPWFMSPEQCRGEMLDARSDIYSLGVVAYQMLSGTPPFTGDAASVIQSHHASQPEPLHWRNSKVPRRISKVIMSALEKDPAARPQTARAFADALRANADGLGVLYRRAFALYSEYFPLIFKLSLLAHIPVISVALLTILLHPAGEKLGGLSKAIFDVSRGILSIGASFITASTISGVTAIIVTHLTAAPLKLVSLGDAFAIVHRRWKPFLKTGMLASVRIFFGFILVVIPGLVLFARYSLWAPVVLMEGLQTKAALKRSRALASRSWLTIIIAMLFQLLLPKLVEKAIRELAGPGSEASMRAEAVSQLASLSSIILLPLLSIVPALLYLKMRQLGGETLADVMAQIETDSTRTKWEQRMRARPTTQRP